MKDLWNRPWFRKAALLTLLAAALLLLILLSFFPEGNLWLLLGFCILMCIAIRCAVYQRSHPLVPAPPAPEPEFRTCDRVPEPRRQQLHTLAVRDDPALLRRLPLPELLFAREAARRAAAPSPRLEEAFPSLLADALRRAPTLYLAVLEATGTPYLSENAAWLFTRLSFCENCIDYFSRQFLFLSREDIPRGELGACLRRLELAGCRAILVDNCEYSAVLPLELLLPPSPDKPEGTANPSLQAACLEFFQTLAQSRYLPDKGEALHLQEEQMLAEILRARFLVPASSPQSPPPEEEASIRIPYLESKNGQQFLPVFTDLPELQKGYSPKDFSTLILDCDEILELSGRQDGFAINPYGFNLVFHQKNLQRLYRYRAEHPEIPK